jgi:hypothetical protein
MITEADRWVNDPSDHALMIKMRKKRFIASGGWGFPFMSEMSALLSVMSGSGFRRGTIVGNILDR